MRKNHRIQISAIACLMAWMICAAAGGAEGENLFANGGFERGDLSGWIVVNPGNHPCSVNVTTETAKVHGGRYALSIEAFKGGKDPLRVIASARVANLSTGTAVRAHVMLKTDNLTLESAKDFFGIMLVATDKAGKTLVSVPWNGTLVGTCPYQPNDILLTLPDGAVKVYLQLNVSAGIKTGSIQVDDASLDIVSDPGPARKDAIPCELRRDAQGTPRLWINGERRAPVIFFGNHGNPVIYEEIAKAARAGVDIVQIPMSLPWSGTSTGMIEQAIQTNPKALILPRVFLHAPQRWLDRHKDQLILNDEGKPSAANNFPSMASDLFFDACKQQIELMIRFLQNSPYRDRIIGYHPDYLAECFFYYEMEKHTYDYSEVNRRRYTRWLEKKYGSLGRLNAAWKTKLASFDAVRIPPARDWQHGDDGIFRDPANPRAVALVDYQMYFNNLTAERLIELAELIKKLTANRSLVAYFYGLQNEFIVNGHENGITQSGHLAMRRVLASPAIDLLCAPTSYHDRAPGGAPNMMSVVDSVTLAGKIFLEEDDARTWLWKEPAQPDYWTLKTEWDTLQCLRRNFGNVIGHNQAIWWMDLCSNGNYNGDSIWASNRKIIETYTDSIARELPTQPEVALIYDEDIFFWLKANCRPLTAPSLVTQRIVFQSLGAQVGYYYIEDLPRLPKSVRLIVFVSTIHMTKEKEALIEALKGDGRTLLWLYAPGYVGERDLSLRRMERLTGFRLKENKEAIQPEIEIAKGSPHPIAKALAGAKVGTTPLIKPLGPTFYGDAASSGSVVLGRYTANRQPAILCQEHAGWTSIFYGSPLLSTPLLRAICRKAGVTLLVEGDDRTTEDVASFNGRYLYVYARGRDGKRQLQLPPACQPVNVKEVISGRELDQGVTRWSDDFKQNEQKVYQLVPAQER